MIKVVIYDNLIPLLDEMAKRSVGLVSESLQVAGSQIALNARAEMDKLSHHWFNAFIDGKYKIWEDPSASKQLGLRVAHTSKGLRGGKSMSNMLSFYLSPNGLTVTVGGTHPYFVPKAFKDGIHVGDYGEPVKAVGTKGRAIIHKLNTGEITPEHPYSAKSWQFSGHAPNFVKNRHFMEKGFGLARSSIDKSLGERFEKSFRVVVNRIDVKGVKRRLA